MDLIERTVTPVSGGAAGAVPSPAAGSTAETDEPTGSDAGWRGTTGQRRWWRIQCSDVVDRARCLTVMVDRDTVVLVGPPGETAVLSPGQLGELRAALREAADQAER